MRAKPALGDNRMETLFFVGLALLAFLLLTIVDVFAPVEPLPPPIAGT